MSPSLLGCFLSVFNLFFRAVLIVFCVWMFFLLGVFVFLGFGVLFCLDFLCVGFGFFS